MATTVNQPQVQQPGVQIYPQYVQQQQLSTPLAALPAHLRRPVYHVSVSLLVLGVACIVFGCICFGVFGYSIPSFTGVNVWVGLLYLIAGALGTSYYQGQNQHNISLMHSFYAFCIISIIFAVPHFGIAVSGIATYGVISGSISLVLCLAGFSLSLTLVIILSQHLYCGRNPYFSHNHVTAVTVTQPAPVVMYQPNMAMQQPVYTTNPVAPGTQIIYTQAGVMPNTAITNTQPQTLATINEKAGGVPPAYNP